MKHLKYFVPGFAALALLAGATVVLANPFYTGTKAQTATATSTQTYMTAGTATTTAVYDSYEQYGTNQNNSGNLTLPNTVAVLLNGMASSTGTVVNVTCEFSDNFDGSNGDWYQNEVTGATTTTTGIQNISAVNSYSFTYASTTVGGIGATTTTNRFQKVVLCPVPLRYVRAVISNTGSNASIWAAIVPTKQRN